MENVIGEQFVIEIEKISQSFSFTVGQRTSGSVWQTCGECPNYSLQISLTYCTVCANCAYFQALTKYLYI